MSLISYAQNGEDVLLWRALGHVRNGFYIDVGANDPLADSVTKMFYDSGWSGINLEPLPAFHEALVRQRPRDINLALAAGASEGSITLFDVPAKMGWATPDPAVAAAHRANGYAVTELTVPVRPLAWVCAQHAQEDIHFLKIDVEGFEAQVLRGMDLRRWRPWILVIEATKPNSKIATHAEWEALVTACDYTFAWFDGLNRYYVAREHAHLIDTLALQPNVFDNAISYHLDSARKASAQARAEALHSHECALRQCARARMARTRERNAVKRARTAARVAQRALAQLANMRRQHDELATTLAEQQRCAASDAQRALSVQAWASELEQHLLAMRDSTSWRATVPLRLAGSVPRRTRKMAKAVASRLRQAALRASASEHLRRLLIPVLLRWPAALGQATRVLAAIRQAPSPPASVLPEMPEALRALPHKARRVLADLERARAQRLEAPAPVRDGRPRLALVSPLPPTRSGVADYSAELAPQLARFYDIELVAAQDRIDDARLAPYPLRSADWFDANAHRYDRVLYHVGNSQAHQYMFALMRRHPGIVVLHDFYLSGVLDNLERAGGSPFLDALYESHGYPGLLEHARTGRSAAIWKYPLNKGVLDHAVGVVVHSAFACDLARTWYGAAAAENWRLVPLLRGARDISRAAARARLKLGPDDYLVCSFGMLGSTKLNDELVDAFLASPLAADPHCSLVFAGQNEAGLYGVALAKKIADGPAARRIRITGFLTSAQYSDYLAACDTAVQLRASTRGETSASVLDCLLHGVPTIVNAHGSNAALDDGMTLKLPDAVTTGELAAALTALRRDPLRRHTLAQRARAYMEAEHAPERVGQLYVDAIEHFARHAPLGRYQRLLREMAGMPAPPDLAAAARAIALEQGPATPRQLLVDVSAMVTADLRTGIQRVVRSVLLALMNEPPHGWRVEPVFSTGANRPYQYARSFMLGLLGVPGPVLEDAPVDLHAGDTFLGLDLFTNGTAQNHDLLQSMRQQGIGIVFVVFDLLPVLHPAFFPFGTEKYFADFLRTVARVSDGVLCISRAVADDMAAWLETAGITRAEPLRLAWFHLGAEIGASAPSAGLPDASDAIFAAMAARPSFLMVGTVEPRKGHAQALDAFEMLWRDGQDVNLVIAGKPGWMMEKLVARMDGHAESGRRLFWLPAASDEMLTGLYERSTALLSASEGEGFGLPLIEAAQHKVPVIARDLAVFREVAGEYAWYFSGLGAGQLAAALDEWLALYREGKAPASAGMPWLSWKESARQVMDAVEGRRWYREVGAPRGCG